jgi:hypothetical protein
LYALQSFCVFSLALDLIKIVVIVSGGVTQMQLMQKGNLLAEPVFVTV